MKMNLIMVLAFGLAPFFLQAAEVTNIFEDGTVDTEHPKTITVVQCLHSGGAILGQGDGTTFDSCKPVFEYHLRNGDFANIESDSELFCGESSDSWDGNKYTIYYQARPYAGSLCKNKDLSNTYKIGEILQSKSCPPDGYPNYTYPHFNEGGEIENCSDPWQIQMVDECNPNSSQEYLSVPVTEPVGCFTTSNGSVCKYDAVDFGGGVQGYALDYEGDCYSDNDYPDLNGVPQETPETSDDMCTEWGGTGMICPENPEDVCESGSSFDGGSINNCQEGCGEINGVFSCMDNDLDGDGLPDYLDPDIDGDGIKNEDDLDNDGDGKDDPVKPNDGGTQSGGGAALDLTPVVSKLEEIKKSMSETNVDLKKEPTPELTGFWQSAYEERDGLNGVMSEKMDEIKQTEFFAFIDKFKPSIGGGSINYDVCFNHIMNFGCHNYNIDPRIFPAIKIFLLLTAVFLCRKIIFGG